jgi:acyl-CoA reductase-like NAD-dependent aldehyde dehydrogenase
MVFVNRMEFEPASSLGNAPFGIRVMKVAPGIATGNVIIIKTSEKAPLRPGLI